MFWCRDKDFNLEPAGLLVTLPVGLYVVLSVALLGGYRRLPECCRMVAGGLLVGIRLDGVGIRLDGVGIRSFGVGIRVAQPITCWIAGLRCRRVAHTGFSSVSRGFAGRLPKGCRRVAEMLLVGIRLDGVGIRV